MGKASWMGFRPGEFGFVASCDGDAGAVKRGVFAPPTGAGPL